MKRDSKPKIIKMTQHNRTFPRHYFAQYLYQSCLEKRKEEDSTQLHVTERFWVLYE